MTPAEDESKLNTLVAKLVKFKNLWDRDAPLARGAADGLCGAQRALRRLHAAARSATRCTISIARRTSRSCSGCCFRASSFPELAMSSEGGLRGAGRERGRLRAARGHHGPDIRDARADLPARHRRHRPRRALGRQGAADARLFPGLPGVVQSLSPASTTKSRASSRSAWTAASSFTPTSSASERCATETEGARAMAEQRSQRR